MDKNCFPGERVELPRNRKIVFRDVSDSSCWESKIQHSCRIQIAGAARFVELQQGGLNSPSQFDFGSREVRLKFQANSICGGKFIFNNQNSKFVSQLGIHSDSTWKFDMEYS